MSRPSARSDGPLELVREPAEPEEHEEQKVAFYCETQGPALVAPRPAVRHEPEVASLSRARIIDVLLYPINVDGFGATVVLALGLWIVRLFPTLFYPLSGDIRTVTMMVAWYLFLAWCAALYFGYCIFDSSKGGRRAPAVWSGYVYTGGELPSVMLLGLVALCLGPATLYRILAGSTDLPFWMLAAPGAFFLPMLLLARTLLGSAEALHPGFLVRSIAATGPAYGGLLTKLALLLLLVGALYLDSYQARLPRVLFYAAYLYSLWIAGHLLGRFYLRQKDKLGWDV